MSKAEEQALKAYPIKIAAREGYDENLRERKGFVKGYNQAEKDLTDKAKFSSGWDGFYYGQGYNQAKQDIMDKAKQWFTDNIPSEKVQLLWCEFEQFIAEN